MIIITGPQSTADERGTLIELAGLLDVRPACGADVVWAEVTDIYHLDGWEMCPYGAADVQFASALGVPVHPLSDLR